MTTLMIRPRSPEEFIALQAAHSLGHLNGFAEHLAAIRTGGLPALLRQMKQSRSRTPGMLPFEIPPPLPDGPRPSRPVLGIKVERRHVAVALVRDLTPERVQVRTLASQIKKAIAGAVRFVTDATAKFPTASVAFEIATNARDTRRRQLTNAVLQALSGQPERLIELSSELLWLRFSVPACRTQGQLRNAVRRCWPSVAKRQHNAALDAMAAAMLAFVQGHLEV